MVISKKLSDALRPSRQRRRDELDRKAKARHRAYLKSQGRHAEADFMLLTNHERLPASFRERFVSGYK
ncbi:hypothetical protein BG841_00170 [Marinobacter sp. X15-166B]|nr:hypothetical protein BG841_00170 [Marinobacter sp. X15-166B]